jgi:hypothetical protein
MLTVERKVFFYKVHDPSNELRSILEKISTLENGNMYTEYPDASRLLYIEINEHRTIIKGKICFYRATDFPKVGVKNTYTTYPLKLKPEEGICNSTHFIFYPNQNLIAIEYNSQGPRLSALLVHICHKIDANSSIHFMPIMKSNMIEELRRLKEITMIDMKVSVLALDQTQYIDASLHSAFENAAKFGEPEMIELKLGIGRKKGGLLNIGADAISKKLESLKDRGVNPGEVFNRFKVRGNNEEFETMKLDILKQWTFGIATVARLGEGREVESDNMYEKIKEVVEDSKQFIQ